MSVSGTIATEAFYEPISSGHGGAVVFFFSCFGCVATLMLIAFSSPLADAVALLGQY